MGRAPWWRKDADIAGQILVLDQDGRRRLGLYEVLLGISIRQYRKEENCRVVVIPSHPKEALGDHIHVFHLRIPKVHGFKSVFCDYR